ncbi:MAG: hypothetical protein JXR96_00165 [Deltaproteobacteria bacterium]|nr:hypothetical protein [Deltaproteobacteria bacterium]
MALALAGFAVLAGCQGCPAIFGECFDPDDPCPNDMVSDESGCVWDRCAGGFYGELVPCWHTERGAGVYTLAGSRGQYLAYQNGEVWVYDLELEEHRRISPDSTHNCFDFLQTDGDRVAWLETMEYEPKWVIDVYAADVATGRQWHVPNPESLYTSDFSISGDSIALLERSDLVCDDMFEATKRTLYLYDLETEQKTLLIDPDPEEHDVAAPSISGDRLVYWRATGRCSGRARSEIWFMDLVTGEERMIDDLTNIWSPPVPCDYDYSFNGRWIVFWMGSSIVAYDVENGEKVEVTRCSIGDCHNFLEGGVVAFDRANEGGKIQRQVHLYELDTGHSMQLTHLRPYYDVAEPRGMAGRRLLWSEFRGESIEDACGNERRATGRTMLLFWKDIEFD